MSLRIGIVGLQSVGKSTLFSALEPQSNTCNKACNRIYYRYMKPYTFRTIIEPDEPSGYHGFVPLLPGVHTNGETIAEVKLNLKEAILCHVQGLLKDGEEIPDEGEVLETVQTVTEKELAFAG